MPSPSRRPSPLITFCRFGFFTSNTVPFALTLTRAPGAMAGRGALPFPFPAAAFFPAGAAVAAGYPEDYGIHYGDTQ